VDATLRKRSAGATANVHAKIAEAQTAWTIYRDAEIALYVHAFAAKSTPDAVRCTILVRLNKERVVDLGRL
jgi:uncharacterized protein YecT (DUF1311 family)